MKGGEPWPPAGMVAAASTAQPEPRFDSVVPPSLNEPQAEAPVAPRAQRDETQQAASPAAASAVAAPAAAAVAAAGSVAVRRGLPRVKGGEPWPPETFAAAPAAASTAPVVAETEPRFDSVVPPSLNEPREAVVTRDLSIPLPSPQTVFPGAAAQKWNADRTRKTPIAAPEPERIGPFTKLQWAGAVIVGGAGLLFAAGMAVLFVRWFLSLPFMVDFVHTYPGQYPLPEGAPVGFPAWLQWQHFFNVFFMVLIIRTGLTVRREKRPTVFWSPKTNPKRKISLTLWFHQSLDILWLVNGAIFVILLLATGQWMRIIPTSWEVIPNAITAALKYVSLDWPTEDGWVNYNSLQQLAYFATVFIAAPLAAITGVRMSGVWPKNAKRLSKAYPVEAARAVHFPVMLYFVLFIIVHVTLVLATGALRNLNHMYGGSDEVNWVGFWIFIASLVVIAIAWVAARPLVLAPIARLFGKVSGR
ncbi:cytochrome b/b6 domain-containing protein [Microbacterium sp. ASV49]|uniref:Cytochrome b/b6 domain-containing protein n=1 Tax=Microbacterium candidum TaxID=3041922 RepID=A0ABT7MXX8_9MICO|nr:cytochrome b/b6 domain-containing protein [Microbacterium sp. ASV49]MDL9979298.1 cytochrome b/b6 domain-containing protein [Microbacterium sp. ASV49]